MTGLSEELFTYFTLKPLDFVMEILMFFEGRGVNERLITLITFIVSLVVVNFKMRLQMRCCVE
jgi:hypothetical protein